MDIRIGPALRGVGKSRAAHLMGTPESCIAVTTRPQHLKDGADPYTRDCIWLNVPYERREQAKQLGAWWSGQKRKWFIPGGRKIKPFIEAGLLTPIAEGSVNR